MVKSIGENDKGIDLFPEYGTLYELVSTESNGLTDTQLDFESGQWGWSEWSIRRQLSHMASLVYRWMLLRWGDVLFPDGNHGISDIKGVAQSKFDRRMDEDIYWDIDAILVKLQESIGLASQVLNERTVGFLRQHTFTMEFNPQWELMIKAHSSGITRLPDPKLAGITLEATMRHMYFEEITHLYNIQRLRKAQGLSTINKLPKVGYWVVEGWDVSEP